MNLHAPSNNSIIPQSSRYGFSFLSTFAIKSIEPMQDSSDVSFHEEDENYTYEEENEKVVQSNKFDANDVNPLFEEIEVSPGVIRN